MEKKIFELKDFTGIEVGDAFGVDIYPSDSFGVSIAADDFPHIRVEKINHTLVIKRQGIEWFAPFHSQPRATVTLPALKELNISGASHGRFVNFQSDDELKVTLSGASHLEASNITAGRMDLKVTGASGLTGDIKTVKEAKLEVTGASKVDLAGAGATLEMKVTGASRTELSRFAVQDARVEISGASNSFINPNGRLDARVSGASKLRWSGTPVMGDIQTSGASSLRRM